MTEPDMEERIQRGAANSIEQPHHHTRRAVVQETLSECLPLLARKQHGHSHAGWPLGQLPDHGGLLHLDRAEMEAFCSDPGGRAVVVGDLGLGPWHP